MHDACTLEADPNRTRGGVLRLAERATPGTPTARWSLRRHRLLLVVVLLGSWPTARAEHEGRLQVLLLGDSTTIGSVCRQTNPDGPHLEDVVRLKLATHVGVPAADVVNQGRDGEFIHGLLESGRYEKEIAPLPGIDYVFIRYGLNDSRKREDFEHAFPLDFRRLIARLRKDFPKAVLVPTTVIPYFSPEQDDQINSLVRAVAAAEELPLFDVHARYQAELAHGVNMLNYRRYPLEKIPAADRDWIKPFVRGDSVVVMDNRLDAHFRELPGWFSDRHPNLAGYHVIGDETAKFLAARLAR